MSENLTIQEDMDFSGRGKFHHKQEDQQEAQVQKKINFDKFKKIAIGAIGAVVLTTGGFAINTAIVNHQKGVIQQEEIVVRATSLDDLLSKIDNEKEESTNYFNKNKVLLSEYDKSQNMISVLGLQGSVSGKQTQNQSLFNQINTDIDQDKVKISDVYKAAIPTQTFDYKKEILLGDDYDKFQSWKSSMDINQFVYVSKLVKLGDSISQELTMLDSLEKDMVNTVQSKIKSGDYNLNTTEQYLVEKIARRLSSETDLLRSVKSEISGSAQEYLLTNNDIFTAEYAVNGIVKVAQEKIDLDKNKVQNLITTYNATGNLNFNEYYVLYGWLAGSSTNQSAAMATGNTINKLQESTTNKYNVSDSGSYINQYLNTNSSVRNYRFQIQTSNDRAYSARRIYRDDQERIRLEKEKARQTQQQAEDDRRAEINAQHEAEIAQRNNSHQAAQQMSQTNKNSSYRPVEKQDNSYKAKNDNKPEIKSDVKVDRLIQSESKTETPKKKYKYDL